MTLQDYRALTKVAACAYLFLNPLFVALAGSRNIMTRSSPNE